MVDFVRFCKGFFVNSRFKIDKILIKIYNVYMVMNFLGGGMISVALGGQELAGRVAFNIGATPIYWYGVIMAVAIAVAFGLAFLLTKPKNLPKDVPVDVFLAIVPLGILSARLFSVLFESGTTILDFFKFRNGGMSIIGALIGGVLGILILCKVKKYKFLQISDLIVPCLILAQAIGRWGNFANGEVYGWLVTNPALQWFPFAVNIDGAWHLALFFYEFVLNLGGFVALMFIYFKTKKAGLATAVYLMSYGAVRLVLESFRDPEYILRLGVLPISQVFAGIMLAAGVALLIYVLKRKEDNEKQKN